MSDINQGIKYTIEADASQASKTLKDVTQQASDNGQQIEKAMAGANAVTSALQGNFTQAIASLGRMTKAVSGLGAVLAKATGWVAVIGAVVAVFKKFKDTITEAKEKLEAVKMVNFDRHINDIKTAQEELTNEVSRTISEIDRELNAETRHLDIIKEKTKAQIELNRQISLEGKSAEEKDLINKEADLLISRTERDAATSKLNAMIAAQANKTERLMDLLDKFDAQHLENLDAYQDPARKASDIFAKATEDALGNFLGLRTLIDNPENRERGMLYLRNNPNKVLEAMSGGDRLEYDNLKNAADKIAAILEDDMVRRESILTAITESEDREEALAKQKEIDDIKTKAAIQAEKNLQAELGEIRLEEGKEQARDLAREMASAQNIFMVSNEQNKMARERLSAAQARVQQAWGWYRDKDSLKAQLDEEKANAEAEKQFEKDFARLSFRRDWRTAKNLTVDQEAVRRVGLAREEEAAAKKAAEETAANTARAADALEAIQSAIAEGGE